MDMLNIDLPLCRAKYPLRLDMGGARPIVTFAGRTYKFKYEMYDLQNYLAERAVTFLYYTKPTEELAVSLRPLFEEFGLSFRSVLFDTLGTLSSQELADISYSYKVLMHDFELDDAECADIAPTIAQLTDEKDGRVRPLIRFALLDRRASALDSVWGMLSALFDLMEDDAFWEEDVRRNTQ